MKRLSLLIAITALCALAGQARAEIYMVAQNLKAPGQNEPRNGLPPGVFPLLTMDWELVGTFPDGGKGDCPIVLEISRDADKTTPELLAAVWGGRLINGVEILQGASVSKEFELRSRLRIDDAILQNYSTSTDADGMTEESFEIAVYGEILVSYFPEQAPGDKNTQPLDVSVGNPFCQPTSY